jgi:hypothetical protein
LIFSYSSGVIPCSSIMAGVMADAWVVDMWKVYFRTLEHRLIVACVTTSAAQPAST